MTEQWVASSPVRGRLVAVHGEPATARAAAARLADRPGWSGSRPPTGLGATAGRWLAGFDLGGGAAGLSALVPEPTFLAALRGLTDAAYLAALRRDGVAWVVDVVDDAGRAVVERLYPDATVVDAAAVASGDLVEPADQGPVAAAPTPPATGGDEALIVVLGSGRSGTTWLHRLLTAHAAVAGTADGETWMFRGVAGFWQAHGSAGLGAWLSGDEMLVAMRACCDRLVAAGIARSKPGADRLVEKTPAHVWQLPLIARLYPDAAFVHLIRDGRDVALSLSRVDAADADLGKAAAAWAGAVRAVRATAPGLSRYTEVRYEDLLRDPVEVAAGVLRWAGVPPDDGFRAAAAARVSERVSPLPSRGPVGAGKWRSLQPAAIADVQDAAGDLLAELGYV